MPTNQSTIFLYLLFVLVTSPLLFFGQLRAMNGNRIPASEMDRYLAHQIDSLHIPSLSIAFFNKGKIVYHKTLGYADVEKNIRADEQTFYEAASMSKTVFAYFIMKMADKGVIALDSPLYKYYPYPEIAYDNRYKLFTARMVLAHTTGLPNWHEYEPPDSSLHVPKGAQYIKFQPGTHFSYSGEGYQYLVNVIAHLLNTSLVDLGKIVDAEVCKPLGMGKSTFSWNEYVEAHRATGYRINSETGVRTTGVLKKFEEFSAAGGLRSNAVDFSHFLIGLMNGKGLTKKSWQEMLKPQSTLTDKGWIEDNGEHWGLGLALKKTPFGIRYFHSGNNGDYTGMYVCYKKQKRGFVLLSNSNLAWDLFETLEPYFMQGKR